MFERNYTLNHRRCVGFHTCDRTIYRKTSYRRSRICDGFSWNDIIDTSSVERVCGRFDLWFLSNNTNNPSTSLNIFSPYKRRRLIVTIPTRQTVLGHSTVFRSREFYRPDNTSHVFAFNLNGQTYTRARVIIIGRRTKFDAVRRRRNIFFAVPYVSRGLGKEIPSYVVRDLKYETMTTNRQKKPYWRFRLQRTTYRYAYFLQPFRSAI